MSPLTQAEFVSNFRDVCERIHLDKAQEALYNAKNIILNKHSAATLGTQQPAQGS